MRDGPSIGSWGASSSVSIGLIIYVGIHLVSLHCVLVGGGKGIFANSPTGATIVDGGTWERSDASRPYC